MNIREQLDDIRTEIKHHKSTIRACQKKINALRNIMKEPRQKIKDLQEKRRRLIFSTVGIKTERHKHD